jgi:aminocarboxymuconate-semialdehyde decarboxylase
MIIDTHAHALDEGFLRGLCSRPQFGLSADFDEAGRFRVRRGDNPPVSLDHELSNIEQRIESLTRRNIGLQLIAPPPGLVSWPGGAANVEYARALNEHCARIVAQGQGRLELMAVLALGEPERCAYELERAVDLYGARSALLPTTAGGRPLDSGEFDRLFTVAERLGLLLFMHPVSAEPPSRFPVYGLQVVVQWPFETTFAMARMIFGGVLDRYPGLQILLAHGGGALIFLRGRLDAAHRAIGAESDPYFRRNISKPPGDYFKQLFFDTCSLSPESVECTIRVAGADRVMFGTDYPFEIGDPEARQALPAIEALPDAAKRKIFRENAEAVLGSVRKTAGAEA